MKVSYWLIPAEPFKTELTHLIESLAARFDGPRFMPHVTLCSGTAVPDSPAEILSTLAPGFHPLELATTGVSFTNQFTKTLFITFGQTPTLLSLYARLGTAVARSPDHEFCPHLSLLYAALPEDTQRALASEINRPTTIYFDAVQAVFTGEVNKTKGDIDSWRVLASERLGTH